MTKGPKTTMYGTYKLGSTGIMELDVKSKESSVMIDQFYIYQGKQYAFGSILCSDGTFGSVIMVRP